MSSLDLLKDYYPIAIFLAVAVVFGVAAVGLSWIVGPSSPDSEKLSPYECGFEPFDDARSKFDVRFYLVAILFIIFDLEVAFLFPWAVTLGRIGVFGFWSMIGFLGILTVGFVYEWRKGLWSGSDPGQPAADPDAARRRTGSGATGGDR